MTTFTKALATLISLVTLLLTYAPIQQAVSDFWGAHPSVYTIVSGLIALLLLVHKPAKP